MIADVRRPAGAGMLKLYRAYWVFAVGRRLRIVGAAALLVSSQLIKLASPWLAAQALNVVQLNGASALDRAAGFIALLLGVAAASWALHGPGRILERSIAVRVRENLADRLYGHLASLPLAWHERHHSGDTVQRVRQTSNALFDFAQSQFVYLQNLVNLAGPVIALGLLSNVLGVAALAGFVVIALVVIRFDRAVMRLTGQQNDAEQRYAAALTDSLGNISTILSLRLQAVTQRLVASRLATVFPALRRAIVINEWKWCGVDLLSITLIWTLVAMYAVLAQSAGTLLIGDVFMVYTYAQQAAGVIGGIAANYQQLARMQADYAAADEIWATAPRSAPPAIVPDDWHEIRLERIALRYTRRAGDGPALADATLSLRRGERLALVGPSGAGKSTLLRVLAGLYDAEDGHFAVDGAIALGLRHLGQVATLIPQEPQAFEGSVGDNLHFGRECSASTLKRATEASAFDSVIAGLPDGLATAVAERGANLSGGQRQRLALARGVLAAAPSSLVLLDEPTASLDAATEAQVLARLLAAFPDACVVASVHRLELLRLFDRVVLMDCGHVLDQGTMDELGARQPLFRQLQFRAQEPEALPLAS
jgi:ATP-binding cassette subfamily B protein